MQCAAATHKPFKAAATTAHRRSPVHAAARPQQQQLEQETHATSATLLDRRSLLLAVGAALAGAAAQQILPPAAAAAEDACEYTTAVGGLQFCDLVEGSGDPPVQGARIRAHYSGRLASNGVQFDSSYDRGRPLIFQVGVGQVIKGWDQGILGAEGIPPMRPGGRRRLKIPSELAYGERGAGGVIPPGATLVFDIEYIGVQGRR